MNCKTQGAVCPRKTLVAATLAALLCGATAPISAQAEVLDIHKMASSGYVGLIGDTDTQAQIRSDATYDGLNINVENPVQWNSLTLQVYGADLTINGDTTVRQTSNSVAHGSNIGNYGLYVTDGGTITLNGNVDIFMREGDGVEFSSSDHYIGTNAIYAYGSTKTESKINVGSAEGTTRIWVIAEKPDAVSVKGTNIGWSSGKSTVEFISTNNQVVGNIDMMGNPLGKATFKATFSGESAYWFGDEQDLKNSYCNDVLSSFWGSWQTFDLTLENGAQYTYLGTSESFSGSAYGTTLKFDTIQKRLSSITLQNGGIINLKDSDIQAKYTALGLDKLLPEAQLTVDHDYIRIGDLKGTGGIFRLDLNPEDHAKSDMIFIEGSSDAGEHQLEISDVDSLTGITEDNPLRFATVAKDAGITFTDKTIAPAESLYDYKVFIGSEDYSADDSRNAEYMDRVTADDKLFDASKYDGGTNWFISKAEKTITPATDAIVDAGSAS